MEEILALILEDILTSDVLPLTLVVISDDLLGEMAIAAEELSEMFTNIIQNFETFQSWCAENLTEVPEIIKQIIGVQMLLSMIHHHWDLASDQNKGIDVETALQDIEATLVKNHAKMMGVANRVIQSSKFSQLPAYAQADLKALVSTSPGAFWKSVKVGIMKSLLKMPIYNKCLQMRQPQ